jgi:hypothetical protein
LSGEPAASHSDPVEQDNVSSDAVPAGIVIEFHETPPLVVMTSYAAAVESWAPAGFGPIATHVVAERHDTVRSTPVPPLTERADQSFPPSLLTRIDAPTDTQNVDVGQSTSPIAPADCGNDAAVHVDPPSVESSTSPAYGPTSDGETPTLTHVVKFGQLTPSNVVSLVGTA